MYPSRFIDPKWYFKIKFKLFFSNKIKVGFGPITSGEDDLAERKWRIDPIINGINSLRDSGYTAGFFIEADEMSGFDIIVIVKKFDQKDLLFIEALKNKNKIFIYDIVDNPNAEEKYNTYFADCPAFASLMDGFITSSPLHEVDVRKFSRHYALIEHPIISSLYKINDKEKDEINIIAHGYYENIKNIKKIEPIIKEISNEINKKITLIYHSEVVLENTDNIKYVKWSVENCFTQLLKADLAIVVKNLHLRHQRTKPSTKVITFMAAGLPVICLPSAADRLVMQHGITGFFAYTLDDWKTYIRLLAVNPKYRHQIARSARAKALSHYSISMMTNKYIALFDQIKRFKNDYVN